MKKTFTYLFTLVIASALFSSTVYAQCGPGQSSVDLSIDFTNDFFPDEDGWKIINTSSGVAIDSACFGDYAAGNNTTITLCLDTGIIYSLYALDDYGDGLDGSEYQLAYTYGAGIDTIGANNFNISFAHCNPAYTNNEIADSTSFYVAYVAPPNCLAPDSLVVSGITSTSVDINWRDNNSATQWEIQFDSIGFTLGNGIDSIVNSNPKTITGLTPDTEYDYYIRSICGVGDTSSWSLMGSFKTAFVCPAGAVCATYTTGGIQTDRNFTSLPGTSTCAASLSVTIPAGNRIDSISTRYDMTAFAVPNNAWLSEQRSWLYSVDATTGEASITSGVGNTDGTLSYQRSGITIANGVTGTADFELHAGRTFGGTGCGSDYSIVDSATWIVIAYYSVAPACLSPLSVFTTTTTSDSAQLNWSGTGTATQWMVEWDTAGFTAGTGSNSIVVNTDTFTTITGLTELSTYEYYVRAICGASDTSTYSAMGTVSTPCDPAIAPYSESFNNTSLPSCWSQSSTTGGPWVFGTPGFTWNNTGCTGSTPSDHTGNSGNYAAMDHSATDAGVILEMPVVDISALTTPYLEFYFTMCGSGYTPLNLLHIEAYNGAGWDSVSVIQQGTNGWELFGFDISSFIYSIDFVKIRFRAESGGSGDDFFGDNAIDDVSIDEAPTCLNPSSQVTSNITSNSTDLNWTENGTATDWQIEYDTSGFTQGSGNDSIVTSKPFSWTGLSSNTTYSWYVRAVCGAGDTSDWVGPISFTTDCPSSFAIPYTEAFNTFVPGCWEEAGSGNPTTGPIDSTGSNWSGDDYLNSGTDGLGAKINLYTNNREDWILSPSFDLSTGGPYQLSVDAGLTNWNNTAIDSMGVDDTVQVLISTDAGVSWTALYTWDTSNEPPSTGTTVTIDLSAYSGTSNNFAIWASDGSSNDPEDYDFHIGNFAIESRPICNEPSSLSAMNVSSDTAFLAWVENGTALEWIIEYDTSGFTTGMGANSVVVNTDTFTTISGLMAQTSYDVYVRAICGAGDTSVWSSGVTFTTLATPIPYYSIGTINSEDANGVADSLNVNSIISGTVTIRG